MSIPCWEIDRIAVFVPKSIREVEVELVDQASIQSVDRFLLAGGQLWLKGDIATFQYAKRKCNNCVLGLENITVCRDADAVFVVMNLVNNLVLLNVQARGQSAKDLIKPFGVAGLVISLLLIDLGQKRGRVPVIDSVQPGCSQLCRIPFS